MSSLSLSVQSTSIRSLFLLFILCVGLIAIPAYACDTPTIYPMEMEVLRITIGVSLFCGALALFLPKRTRMLSIVLAAVWVGLRIFLSDEPIFISDYSDYTDMLKAEGVYYTYVISLFLGIFLPMLVSVGTLLIRKRREKRSLLK